MKLPQRRADDAPSAEPEELMEVIPVEPGADAGCDPARRGVQTAQGEVPELRAPRLFGTPVRFRMYANYSAFIDRSEVRIFQADQSTQADAAQGAAGRCGRLRGMGADGGADALRRCAS